MSQLFSNLRTERDQLIHYPGSLWGAVALIAGTAVGAGVLALPAVTVRAGVIPSSMTLIGVWVYMVITGLLIAEVNLNTICSLGKPELGLWAMSERTLGLAQSRLAGLIYTLLHYGVLVAYIAQGGTVLMSVLEPLGISQQWIGPTVFASGLISLMLLGGNRITAIFNTVFVIIVLGSFVGLIALGLPQLHPVQLLQQNWSAVSVAVPIMFVTLVFQSVVPVITSHLEGNRAKIQQAIILGSAVPLILFLIWNAVILGISDLNNLGETTFLDPLELLRQGGLGPLISVMVSIFSEFAVATSFIGFVYGLLDLYTDVLNTKLEKQMQRTLLHIIIVVPPLICAIFNPTIFFTALDYTGTFGVLILFGILPALMAWQQRYQPSGLALSTPPLVPGGRFTLILIISIGFLIMFQQIWMKQNLL